jgi:L-rhamnose-H+ transport protein
MQTSSHPAVGFVIVVFSGMMTASFAAPMKLSRRWRWENLWLVYSTLALLLIPTALVVWSIPHPFMFYTWLSPRLLFMPLLFGCGWGIAQVTFGLSIARTGRKSRKRGVDRGVTPSSWPSMTCLRPSARAYYSIVQ